MADEFDYEVDDRNVYATHRKYGHVYDFVIGDEEPYVRGGTVHENQTAAHGPREFFESARASVERYAREHGLIPA